MKLNFGGNSERMSMIFRSSVPDSRTMEYTHVLNRYGIVSCPIFSNNEPVRLKGPVSHMATDIRVITWYVQAQIHTQPVLQGLHGHIYKSNVCVGHPYWRN